MKTPRAQHKATTRRTRQHPITTSRPSHLRPATRQLRPSQRATSDKQSPPVALCQRPSPTWQAAAQATALHLPTAFEGANSHRLRPSHPPHASHTAAGNSSLPQNSDQLGPHNSQGESNGHHLHPDHQSAKLPTPHHVPSELTPQQPGTTPQPCWSTNPPV